MGDRTGRRRGGAINIRSRGLVLVFVAIHELQATAIPASRILTRADSGDIVPKYIGSIRLEVCKTGKMFNSIAAAISPQAP